MHSSFSIDGKDNLETLCKQAIKQGIPEIALTDHFEPRTNDNTYKEYDPAKIWLEVKRMNLKLYDKLTIRMGIEIGQPHQFEQETCQVLNAVPYDYVLASMHYSRKIGDIALACVLKKDSNELMKAYLGGMNQMIDFKNFDCVGHIDLPIRYCCMYDCPPVIIDDYRDQVKDIFKKIIDNGKGIEINTSGLRVKNLNRPLITKKILMLYKELGGEVLTIGSDAHCANDVGKGIQQGVELAKEAGFNYITTFQERKPTWLSIKNIQSPFQIKNVG